MEVFLAFLGATVARSIGGCWATAVRFWWDSVYSMSIHSNTAFILKSYCKRH